jgi:long-chain acyl-CoA synthetase
MVMDGTAATAMLDERTLRATLPGRLAWFAKQRPDAPALRHKHLGIWEEITWAQYYARTSAVARALWEHGIRPGGHAGILSDNRPEWLFSDLAIQALGARSVGVYQTSPAADVQYVLSHSQSTVLFCEDQEQVDKLMEIGGGLPELELIVVFEPRGTRGYADARLMAFDDFLAEGAKLLEREPGFMQERLAVLDPNAASMIVYTSGTTGQPKGAMLSSANVCEPTDAIAKMLNVTERDAVLSYLPLCHVAEKIYSVNLPLATGLVVHFGESIDTVQEDLREVSPTIFLGVPRIWEKMHASLMIRMKSSSWLKRTLFFYFVNKGLELEKRRSEGKAGPLDALIRGLGDVLVFRALQERLGLRRCRVPGSGAAPIARELLEWFHGVGVKIYEGFGMTELAGGSHFNRPSMFKLGTVGPAVEGVTQRLAEDGEILLRGKCVFLGYLHNEAATRAMIDEEGWLHTGDIGAIDGDGFLQITGRKKEIIITAGGKNLSPERIENALKTSAYVKEAVAIGDTRKFVSALVQIEYDTVGDWAQRQSLPYTSYPDLASKPEVIKLIEAEVERCNALLGPVEQVRKVKILPKELHQDDGELTATQKVRRKVVTERYSDLIAGMYRGGGS